MTEQTDSNATGPRHKSIFLLPNLFTTAAMFAGFYAIVAAQDGRFSAAAIAIFIAMILDTVDGRVARMTNTTSDFGVEYDSLSDMISFGLAPALVVYEWALHSMGKLGWLVAFVYAVSAALRLARFNTHASLDKKCFQGLPSPSAAALLASFIWVINDYNMDPADFRVVMLMLTLVAAILMVSNVPYRSFKDFDMRSHVPFVVLLGVVTALVVVVYDPPRVLFGGFLVYTLSGPVLALKGHSRKTHADEEQP